MQVTCVTVRLAGKRDDCGRTLEGAGPLKGLLCCGQKQKKRLTVMEGQGQYIGRQ